MIDYFHLVMNIKLSEEPRQSTHEFYMSMNTFFQNRQCILLSMMIRREEQNYSGNEIRSSGDRIVPPEEKNLGKT